MTSRRELDVTDFFFQIEPTLGGNIFVSDFFSTSAVSRPIFFPDYWNKTADFWESLRSFRSSQSTAESVFIWSLQNLLNRPDRPDRTQFYSSDQGRLRRLGRLRSSWQCSPFGRPDRLNIIRDRLGRSGLSYAWKTGFSKLFAVASSFHSL